MANEDHLLARLCIRHSGHVPYRTGHTRILARSERHDGCIAEPPNLMELLLRLFEIIFIAIHHRNCGCWLGSLISLMHEVACGMSLILRCLLDTVITLFCGRQII